MNIIALALALTTITATILLPATTNAAATFNLTNTGRHVHWLDLVVPASPPNLNTFRGQGKMTHGTNTRVCGHGNSPVSRLVRTPMPQLFDDPNLPDLNVPAEYSIVWYEISGCEWPGTVRGVMVAAFPAEDLNVVNRTDLVTFAVDATPVPADCPSGHFGNLTFVFPADRQPGMYTLQFEYTTVGPAPPAPVNGTAPPPPTHTIIQCADVLLVPTLSAASALTPPRAALLLALALALSLLA